MQRNLRSGGLAIIAVATLMLAVACGGSDQAASAGSTPDDTSAAAQPTSKATNHPVSPPRSQSSQSSSPQEKAGQGTPSPTTAPRATSTTHSTGPSTPDNTATGKAPAEKNSDKSRSTAHPKAGPPVHHDQTSVLKSLPGSHSATCVPVGNKRNVRSAGIAAGNFRQARDTFKKATTHKKPTTVFLYVIPQHAKHLSSVTVTMTPVNHDGKAHSLTSKQVETANNWQYFPVHVSVPKAGTWQLKMTSGSDRGCFNVTFSS